MSPEDKKTDDVTQRELLAEDPAQTRPPAQILLEDDSLIDSVAPGKKATATAAPKEADPQTKKPMTPGGVSQSELLEEDPAQTDPPAQILLEDTSVIKK